MRILSLTGFLLFLLMSCKSNSTATQQDNSVLQDLYEVFKEGEISECMLDGEMYYVAAWNAYDAGSEIYDSKGNKVGVCYYSTNQVHDLCDKLVNCEVVYCVENNIWGETPVNKYDLK